MNIASGQTRAELGIACLSPEVRNYIADLELEVSRLHQRSKAHRQNIRSMQAKCRLANVQAALRYAQELRASKLAAEIDSRVLRMARTAL